MLWFPTFFPFSIFRSQQKEREGLAVEFGLLRMRNANGRRRAFPAQIEKMRAEREGGGGGGLQGSKGTPNCSCHSLSQRMNHSDSLHFCQSNTSISQFVKRMNGRVVSQSARLSIKYTNQSLIQSVSRPIKYFNPSDNQSIRLSIKYSIFINPSDNQSIHPSVNPIYINPIYINPSDNQSIMHQFVNQSIVESI